MKKVALYVRVSTREQAEEGYSVGAQLEKMKLFCESKDWTIVDEYVDGGFSGSNLNRPAMHKLIMDVTSDKMDMVLVYKLDRLSRSQKDTLYLIEEIFNANGVDFTSMQENFDTSTPLGMAMVGILSVFAQLERSQIAERMMMGKDAKVKDGFYLGHARAPIGYDYDASTGMLIPNEYEAAQVREIFRMFTEENLPILAIQRYMNQNYSTRYGNYSVDSTIRKILSNPVYTGRFSYKGEIYESTHEPIIDDDTFEKAGELLNIRKESLNQLSAVPFARTTLLSGLIWCGRCGARFGGDTRTYGKDDETYKRKIYCCYTRKKNPRMMTAKSCKMRFVDRDEIEEYVWKSVLSVSKRIMNGSVSIWGSYDRADEIMQLIMNAKSIKESGTLEEQRKLIFTLIDRITVMPKRVSIKYRFD